MIVKSAEDWLHGNSALPQDASARQRILSQGQMGPALIVLVGVCLENSP
jgi:hypothetical protein